MVQTSESRLTGRGALRWRAVVGVVLTGVVGVGGMFLLSGAWSDARHSVTRSVDRMLWTQALKGHPAATDLSSAAPVWREREGASGDRIIERVDARGSGPRHAASSIAVLEQVGGETLPPAMLAEQAATPRDAGETIRPASFDGLAAGDRVTITTTDGRVYAFEVLMQGEKGAAPATDGQRFVFRMVTRDGGEEDSIVREVKPIGTQQPVASQPQHEL